MTPREKAEQLFTKFADIEHLGVYGDYDGNWEWSSSLWRKQAKESAIIAVDEILNLDIHDVGDYKCFDTPSEWYISYWSEVKHEIEKL
jgi:hypothetical protein